MSSSQQSCGCISSRVCGRALERFGRLERGREGSRGFEERDNADERLQGPKRPRGAETRLEYSTSVGTSGQVLCSKTTLTTPVQDGGDDEEDLNEDRTDREQARTTTIEESRSVRNVLEGSQRVWNVLEGSNTCQMDEKMKNISTKTAPNESSPQLP